MTPQELLKPRYKIIADFPLRGIGIGTVLTPEDETVCFVLEDGIMPTDLTRYPNLFKKLEWHEEIKPEDMPEYVKRKDASEVFKRVFRYDGSGSIMVEFPKGVYGKGTAGPVGLLNVLPATEQEYNDYIKTKQSA